MVILNSNPMRRPDCCSFDSIAGLYQEYRKLMRHSGREINSCCGHRLLIFDHHFFHLAAVRRHPEAVLSMPGEMEKILATTEGLGPYELAHNGSRARNLPSAFATMDCPDEVWEDHPKAATARWVYIKQFDSLPYPYTVALIGERPAEGGILVPFSSFPCSRSDIKRWRKGTRVHPKTDAAT